MLTEAFSFVSRCCHAKNSESSTGALVCRVAPPGRKLGAISEGRPGKASQLATVAASWTTLTCEIACFLGVSMCRDRKK